MVLQQRYQVTGLFSMAHADYPVICSHRLPREHASLKAASKEIEAFQLFLWPEEKKKKFRQFSTWMDHFQTVLRILGLGIGLMTHFGPRIWISEENFGLWNRILVSHPRPPSWPLYRDEGPTFSHMPKWIKFMCRTTAIWTTLVRARGKTKEHLSLFLYRAQNLPSLSFLSTNITLSTLLILAVCRTRVIWTS